METKQKMFRFTPRTVDLLKIVAGLNQLSETEMLEIALEAVASPEALNLINSIHGERVNRKTLRKPRTTKPKETQESKGPDLQDNKVLSIIESIKDKQIQKTSTTKEIAITEIIDEKSNKEIEVPAVSLDTLSNDLLEMYS